MQKNRGWYTVRPPSCSIHGVPAYWRPRIQRFNGNQGTGATTTVSARPATWRTRSRTKMPYVGRARLGKTELNTSTRGRPTASDVSAQGNAGPLKSTEVPCRQEEVVDRSLAGPTPHQAAPIEPVRRIARA